MAEFDTWKFASLVAFATEAQARIKELETQLQDTRTTLNECDKDRKDLLTEVRRLILRGDDT